MRGRTRATRSSIFCSTALLLVLCAPVAAHKVPLSPTDLHFIQVVSRYANPRGSYDYTDGSGVQVKGTYTRFPKGSSLHPDRPLHLYKRSTEKKGVFAAHLVVEIVSLQPEPSFKVTKYDWKHLPSGFSLSLNRKDADQKDADRKDAHRKDAHRKGVNRGATNRLRYNAPAGYTTSHVTAAMEQWQTDRETQPDPEQEAIEQALFELAQSGGATAFEIPANQARLYERALHSVVGYLTWAKRSQERPPVTSP